MTITMQDYVEACNFPGQLDEAEVERQLHAYLKALGIEQNLSASSAAGRWVRTRA